MKIKPLNQKLSICKLKQIPPTSTSDLVFYARTDEEISMVCETDKVPRDLLEENSSDGWRAFRIVGKLDFSLTGILAKISKILADNSIGIFAVSTFNTDYILIQEENFNRALDILVESDYEVEGRVKSHSNVIPLISKEEREFEDVTLEEINQRLEELEQFIFSIKEKKFRAKQVWTWLWKKGAGSYDEMTDLSLALRSQLAEHFTFKRAVIDRDRKSTRLNSSH